MDLYTIYSYYKKLYTDNLSFIYLGVFDDTFTDKLIGLSEYNIDSIDQVSKVKKKVSFLMAENFQNIIRHGEDTTKKASFLTRNIGKIFYITSGNLIDNKQVAALKLKLNKINSLDKDELKALYLDILSNEEFSNKGGAGLGLIEMARKSGQKLEFEFEKVNDKFSLFYLQIKLQGKDSGEQVEQQKHVPLNINKEFSSEMSLKNVFFIFKGALSQDTIMPLLAVIEENLADQLKYLKVVQKVYLTLAEILQNISKHSQKTNGFKDGLFVIGREGEQCNIGAGNCIENDKVDYLKTQLKYINNLNKQALNELYKKKLKEGKYSSKSGAELGLIDIARKSSDGKILYNFKSIDEKTSFYSLNVVI